MLAAASVAVLLRSGTAFAQAKDEPTAPPLEYAKAITPAPDRKDGFIYRLSIAATVNFTDNRSVVGQQDGSTLAAGFKFDALAYYNAGPHEWRNTLALGAGLVRSPAVDMFVKSRDGLDFESIYLFHVVRWFGAFARGAVDAPMFRGTDVRAQPTTYAVARLDGTTDLRVANALVLTDPFRPLTLKESVGPFVQPVSREDATIEARAGAGARQTFARAQLAVDDDAATPSIEVNELANVFQIGAEGALEAHGLLSNKRVAYKALAEAMVPFWHNDLPLGRERSAFALTNVLLEGLLSFKLVDWASVDYELRIVREPQLIDVLQVHNDLLLTFGVTAPNPEEKPVCPP